MGGTKKVSGPNDIAPWLESSEELRERIAAEADSEQVGFVAKVASAYMARKGSLDG